MEQVCDSYCTEWDKKGAREPHGPAGGAESPHEAGHHEFNLHRHSSLTGIKKAKKV